MADLIKGVLGGGWSLVVGWILPVFVTLQLITVLVLPTLPRSLAAYHQFEAESGAEKQLTLLAVAAVAGLVLAACQAPLYRFLEGYSALWPPTVAERRINRHRARRARLVATQQAISVTQWGVRSGLLYQRAGRYPASDRQFAPTLLGNSIRRFETYAGDYTNSYFGELVVSVEADALVLHLGPKQTAFPMRHFDHDVFVYQPVGENAAGESAVSFAIGADGLASCVTVEILDINRQGTFTRAKKPA